MLDDAFERINAEIWVEKPLSRSGTCESISHIILIRKLSPGPHSVNRVITHHLDPYLGGKPVPLADILPCLELRLVGADAVTGVANR